MRDDIHTNVLVALAGIFGVVIVAAVITTILGRVRPTMNLDEMRARIRSWWIMVAVGGRSRRVWRGSFGGTPRLR